MKLEKIIDDSEEQLRTQVKNFFQESGKYLAVAVFGIFSLLATGNELLAKDIVPIIYGIPFAFASILIYFILWKNRQKEKRRVEGLKSIAITLNKLQDQIEFNDRRIKVFQENTNEAIYEFSCKKNQFIFCNGKFLNFFGIRSMDDLNTIITNKDSVDVLVHEDFAPMVKNRLEEDREEYVFKNIWLKRQNGDSFPADIKIIKFKFNSDFILQGHIVDITSIRSLTERIAALENLVQNVVGLWSKKRARIDIIKEHTNFLKNQISGELCNE